MVKRATDDVPFEIELNQFKTLNTRDAAIAMADDEMPYCQNFMPIGTSLYTVPGISSRKGRVGSIESAWTANTAVGAGAVRIPTTYNGFIYFVQSAHSGTTGLTEPVWPTTQGDTVLDGSCRWTCYSLQILRMFDVNISGTMYKIVATVGGLLYRFTDNFTQTRIYPTQAVVVAFWTITTKLVNPQFAQWKSSRLLIVDPFRGYSIYNGTVVADDESTADQFNSTYKANCVAVFATRVWLGGTNVGTTNNRTISYSAPDTYLPAGFTATGSGSVIDNYSSLRTAIIQMAATQEYLYVIGDHAVHVIHGVQLIDSGATTFQLLDAIPGIGTYWPDSVKEYRGTIYLANEHGVWAVQGTKEQHLSSLLDGIWARLTSFKPHAFFAKMNGKLVYVILLEHTDLLSGNTVRSLCSLYEGRWFTVNYGDAYTNVCAVSGKYVETDSTSFLANGTDIYQIFTGTSVMTRKARTKSSNLGYATKDKQILRVGLQTESLSSTNKPFIAIVSILGDLALGATYVRIFPAAVPIINAYGAFVTPINFTIVAATRTNKFGGGAVDGRGKRIQVDVQETSDAQYVITGIPIEGKIGAGW